MSTVGVWYSYGGVWPGGTENEYYECGWYGVSDMPHHWPTLRRIICAADDSGRAIIMVPSDTACPISRLHGRPVGIFNVRTLEDRTRCEPQSLLGDTPPPPPHPPTPQHIPCLIHDYGLVTCVPGVRVPGQGGELGKNPAPLFQLEIWDTVVILF